MEVYVVNVCFKFVQQIIPLLLCNVLLYIITSIWVLKWWLYSLEIVIVELTKIARAVS